MGKAGRKVIVDYYTACFYYRRLLTFFKFIGEQRFTCVTSYSIKGFVSTYPFLKIISKVGKRKAQIGRICIKQSLIHYTVKKLQGLNLFVCYYCHMRIRQKKPKSS